MKLNHSLTTLKYTIENTFVKLLRDASLKLTYREISAWYEIQWF